MIFLNSTSISRTNAKNLRNLPLIIMFFLGNPLVFDRVICYGFKFTYFDKLSLSLIFFTLSLELITHGIKQKTKNSLKSIEISHFRREIIKQFSGCVEENDYFDSFVRFLIAQTVNLSNVGKIMQFFIVILQRSYDFALSI